MLQKGDLLANRYQAVRLLGTGGFSRVWEAVDLGLNARRVAIKELMADGAEARLIKSQFKRELEVLSGLSHAGLPTIYDGLHQQPHYYLVLEFVPGAVLDQVRAERTPSVDEVLRWGGELLDILQYLHERPEPLVVRDLKPSNVIVSEDGRLRLVDFGIAAVLRTKAPVATTLAGFGTPGYAAPEQYGRQDVDARTDLYALGATLYYLLSGEVPPDAIDRVMGRAPLLPLRQFRPEIPPALATCIENHLMNIRPEGRPLSAAAARAALQEAARSTAPPAAQGKGRVTFVGDLGRQPGRIMGLAFLEDGTHLLVAGPEVGVRLLSLAGHPPREVVAVSKRPIGLAVWRRTMAVALPQKPGVLVMDLTSGLSLDPLPDMPGGVTCVALSEYRIAAGLADKSIRLWSDGRLLHRLHGATAAPACIAFSADGEMLASGGADKVVRAWSVTGGGAAAEMAVHHGAIHGVCFVGQRPVVATASWDRTLAMWNITDNAVMQRLRGHQDGVACVAASHDGRWLASGSWDRTVRFWDASTGAPGPAVHLPDAVSSVAFAPTSWTLAVACRDGTVQLLAIE